MSKIVISSKFKRAYRKFTRRNIQLQARIETTITELSNDVFNPSLGTHKLEGKLIVLKPSKNLLPSSTKLNKLALALLALTIFIDRPQICTIECTIFELYCFISWFILLRFVDLGKST